MRSNLHKPSVSLLIPSFNGLEFLSRVLPEVLSRVGSDCEIVVSDGCSGDGTGEYLLGLRDSRLKIVSPNSRMSMADHWNWVSTFATGRWQMFLGQDDFLQFDFQKSISRLIAVAEASNLHVIVARRAFYDWPGCTQDFPRGRAHLFGVSKERVVDTRYEMLLALSGLRSYHTISQMYTSCLVSESLVNQIRDAQGGSLIVAHPQDASLAASILTRKKYALRSSYPISWVGTSTKSAGLAIQQAGTFVHNQASNFSAVASEYLRAIEKSPIKFPIFAGDFSLGEGSIYLWQAILNVAEKQGAPVGKTKSLILLSLAFFGCFSRSNLFERKTRAKLFELRRIAGLNGLPRGVFWLVGVFGFLLNLGRTVLKRARLPNLWRAHFSARSRSVGNKVIMIDDVRGLGPESLNDLVARSNQ